MELVKGVRWEDGWGAVRPRIPPRPGDPSRYDCSHSKARRDVVLAVALSDEHDEQRAHWRRPILKNRWKAAFPQRTCLTSVVI